MKKIIRLFAAILLIAVIMTSILLLTGCSFSIGNKDSTSTTKSNNGPKSKPSTNDSTPSTIVNPNDGDDGEDGDENDEGGAEYTPTPEEIAQQQDYALAVQYEEQLESTLAHDVQACDSHIRDVNVRTVEILNSGADNYLVMKGSVGYQSSRYRTFDYKVRYAVSNEFVEWFNNTLTEGTMEEQDLSERYSSEIVKTLADSYYNCETEIYVKVGNATFNYTLEE